MCMFVERETGLYMVIELKILYFGQMLGNTVLPITPLIPWYPQYPLLPGSTTH